MSYLTAELFEATGALLVQLGDGGDDGASVPGADEVHLQLPGADQGDVLQACHAGVVHQQALRISYRKWASEAADDRTVHPYRLVANDGQLYLVARCLRSDGVKWFRVDRIEAATVRSERFAIPEDAALEALLREGRPDFTGASEQLTMRFTGESARVVAEREGVVCAGDGSLVRHFPLADRSWAVAFVLRFGEDAEALAPTSVREAILEQLSW
jgi:predicted DNA-binding transcriptional regulator YafY